MVVLFVSCSFWSVQPSWYKLRTIELAEKDLGVHKLYLVEAECPGRARGELGQHCSFELWGYTKRNTVRWCHQTLLLSHSCDHCLSWGPSSGKTPGTVGGGEFPVSSFSILTDLATMSTSSAVGATCDPCDLARPCVLAVVSVTSALVDDVLDK